MSYDSNLSFLPICSLVVLSSTNFLPLEDSYFTFIVETLATKATNANDVGTTPIASYGMPLTADMSFSLFGLSLLDYTGRKEG